MAGTEAGISSLVDLGGRIAVVTGGTAGIGAQLVVDGGLLLT